MKNFTSFLKTSQGMFVSAVVILIIGLLAYYFNALRTGEIKTGETIVISETDHVRGNQSGTVTLVEFGDFQCPACATYEPLVREVVSSNPNLKLVFRHFPLTQIHQNALLAAKVAEAAGLQGKFWEMHDILYDRQTDWSGSLNAREAFLGYAKELSLDVDKISSALNNASIEEKVLSEYKEGNRLGVQGTPTFFLNGKKINNPRSIEDFNNLIKSVTN